MAMTIFFLLIAMGVLFLLYVAANFWKEGHRPQNVVLESVVESSRREKVEVIVITHPISAAAHGGLSVIPLQVSDRGRGRKFARKSLAKEMIEVPVTRISTTAGGSRSQAWDYHAVKDQSRC